MQRSEITVTNEDDAPVQMKDDFEFTKQQAVDPEEFKRELQKAVDKQRLREEGPDRPTQEQDLMSKVRQEQPPIPEKSFSVEEPVSETHEEDHDEDHEEHIEQPIIKNTAKGRINKEIEKRKALEEQLYKEREERIRAQTELDMYNRAMTTLNTPKQAPTPEIDPVDPDAHQLYMQKIADMERRIEQQQQQMQQTSLSHQFVSQVNQQQQEFMREAPDFDQAYQYLMEKERSNLLMMGAPEHDANKMVTEKLYIASQNALQNGKSVPEMIYKLAQNIGYTPSEAAVKAKGSINLSAIEKNKKNSADLTREVPAVATTLRKNSYDPAHMRLEEMNDRIWEDGKFNKDAFNKMVAAAAKVK